MESTSMTSKYMSFSPELVNERNVALNNCPTKSGRSKIYRTYYLKMKDAYEKHEDEQDEDEDTSEAEDDEDYEPSEAEDDEDYEPSEDDEEEPENEVIDSNEVDADEYFCCGAQANEVDADEVDADEVDANEVDANEVDADEEEGNVFGCAGCNYEWRDGYKNGWRDAMKYIAGRTYKEVPDTPACSYCDIVCKTRKCGGKCGGTVRYCSVDCQKKDWSFGHKNECGK